MRQYDMSNTPNIQNKFRLVIIRITQTIFSNNHNSCLILLPDSSHSRYNTSQYNNTRNHHLIYYSKTTLTILMKTPYPIHELITTLNHPLIINFIKIGVIILRQHLTNIHKIRVNFQSSLYSNLNIIDFFVPITIT